VIQLLDDDRAGILHGDSALLGSVLQPNSIEAMVCDPPAGIAFMGKKWDKDKGGRNGWIAWLRDLMRPAFEALKPGAHGLVWALPRTSHWTATALEDVGFEIRDVHHHIFGCVPPETEMLTADGWKLPGDLCVDDIVVEVDERGRASRAPLQAVSWFDFDGNMRRIRTRSTEQLLTPGHSVHAYAKRAKWQRVEIDQELSKVTADELTDRDHAGVAAWQLPLAARGADERMSITVDEAALLGWVIAEGHFHADVQAVSIYQNEGAYADKIRSLLARLGIEHSEYKRTRSDYDGTDRFNVQWYLRVGTWSTYIRRLLSGKKPTPSQDLAWLPEDQALALFDALVSGDGSRNVGDQSGAWYQKRPEVRAWFQTLCFRLGYRSTENAEKCAVQWCRSDSTEVARGAFRNRWASEVYYKGKVWCPTVPSGRWVARYKGNVFVTGNTGFPKSLTSASAEIPEWSGTAFKPAVEHWILVRKPLAGTVGETFAEYGTGVLNIDGCRIGSDDDTRRNSQGGDNGLDGTSTFKIRARAVEEQTKHAGRWPAHLTFEHALACTDEQCVIGCPVRLLDEQSGQTKSTKARSNNLRQDKGNLAYGHGLGHVTTGNTYSDKGGASRFFYVAKGSRDEKDEGLEHLTPKSAGEATGRDEDSAGVNNPRAGAGRTGGARNFHPTVKSVALMRWLVRLVTPPGGTVLDPFAGSGTTGVAALAEGCKFIGCEQGGDDGEYLPILVGRIQHALAKYPQ
jgi:hypothetical protein